MFSRALFLVLCPTWMRRKGREEERERGREKRSERGKREEEEKKEERKFRTPNAAIRKFECISDNGVQTAI